MTKTDEPVEDPILKELKKLRKKIKKLKHAIRQVKK
jgi:hypothetical protein